MRLEDILEAIARIDRATAGMTFETFHGTEVIVDAVVRNFTVIGEAARHIPPEIEARYPDVPWLDMRDMRNVVVHEYFAVNLRILWATVQQDLPPLTPRLHEILEREQNG